MNPTRIVLAMILTALLAPGAGASTLYVNLNNPTPTPPYASWSTAATDIQAAVDTANPGDTVLVTNGVYQSGARVVSGAMMNRVAVTKPILVQSVAGPAVTIIQGNPVLGDAAVRCVYLGPNAMLSGFTLGNGATRAAGDVNLEQCGGGLWCGSGSIVTNCVLTGNSAWNFGGGAYQGTLESCAFSNNNAFNGGGAYAAGLDSCTILGNSAAHLGGGTFGCSLSRCRLNGNSAWSGGGTFGGTLNSCSVCSNVAQNFGGGSCGDTLNNCTLVGNSAGNGGSGASGSTLNNSICFYNFGENYDGCTFNFSCTAPDPRGMGNIVSAPSFVDLAAGDLHLNSDSPCINTGNNSYTAGTTDLDGNPRVVDSVVDMGAYEYQSTVSFVVSIQANGTNAVVGYPLDFTALFAGGLATNVLWSFGDGSSTNNVLSVSHAWSTVGSYPVVMTAFNQSNPGGVSATVTVHIVQEIVRYVSASSTNSVSPYTSWATAAFTLQDALNVASSGDLVLVSNGVYNMATGTAPGSPVPSRAAVTKVLTLQSVNGPGVTLIDGAGTIRCVYLTDGAVLSGFTLTNGSASDNGGGVWCNGPDTVVSNCVIQNNSASLGGGAYQGILRQCRLNGNSASYGGGAYSSALYNCQLTGNSDAADFSTLYQSVLVSNVSGFTTLYYSSLTNCILTGNQGLLAFRGTFNNCLIVGNDGDAAAGAALINCTVVSNLAGVSDCSADSCILYGNDTQGGANYVNNNELGAMVLNHCCTTPDPGGLNGSFGNITNLPGFVDPNSGDYHLQSNSPCINSGVYGSTSTSTDLDGNPRVQGGTVDIGAYEYQSPTSVLSYAWLHQYGLPINGSVDFADTDGDGRNNWQEWRADTSPIDATSVLKMLSVSNGVSGATVTWQSAGGVTYYLQSTAFLGVEPLLTIQSNLVGQVGTTSFLDQSATNGHNLFYRVGVQ